MLIQSCIEKLKERKRRVENGQINCIPHPFTRFRTEWPGIEKKRYYIVTAQTKGGKTQITSFLFLFNIIFFALEHPEIHPKIFYYNLEEEQDEIVYRFMSYILYKISNGQVRISPTDLQSTDERKPLGDDILALLESEEYQRIMTKFEEVVMFQEDRNPTGVWKTMYQYGKESHNPIYKEVEIDGEKKQVVDKWEPKDPDEYVIILIDHVSLIDTEKGMDLRESIAKLSKYLIILRNKFEMIPVVVQQQSTETGNLDAFKAGKIRPTRAGLADCKDTGKDCNMIIGISNPHSFEVPAYLGYDITKLQDRARFFEIVVNRNGRSNGICPLYFDGAVNFFKELPSPKDYEGMQKVYNLIEIVDKSAITMVQFVKNLFKVLHN